MYSTKQFKKLLNHFEHLKNMSKYQIGRKGHEWRDENDAQSGSGVVYYALVASVDSTITYRDRLTDTTNTSVTVPKGFIIYGEMDNLDITSGTILCYLGKY